MNDIEIFERRAAGYEQSFSQFFVFDRVHQAALQLLPAGLQPISILDIGCGTGRLLRRLAIHWPCTRLVGVDPAENMIAQARTRTPEATFYVSTAENLSLPGMNFDLVVSTMSFHHWVDQFMAVDRVANLLYPGGYFLLADQVPPFGLSKIIHHGRPANSVKRKQIFSQTGLKIITEKYILSHFILITLGQRN